ncbi:hypothetical protein GRAN_3549 [Granulicella sibirica]|uniref:Uncharacterized protein n=1 Tax=Granulicella sibirica TaxID=2479048 RepID=A0A4Q0T1L9_9BACT|nr:hypothetical protein GRAN_3549 [Granulicella sibirica]
MGARDAAQFQIHEQDKTILRIFSSRLDLQKDLCDFAGSCVHKNL